VSFFWGGPMKMFGRHCLF